MIFEKLMASVLELFFKKKDSSSVLIQAGSSSDPSIVEPSLAETVEEPVSRDQDDLTQLQIELLVETVMAKGRSLAEQIHLLQVEDEVTQSLPNCVVCWQSYSKKRVPLVGTCGHTVCRRCVWSMGSDDCPTCRGYDSFRHPVKNFLACDLIEQMNKLRPYEKEEEEEQEDDEEADYRVDYGVDNEVELTTWEDDTDDNWDLLDIDSLDADHRIDHRLRPITEEIRQRREDHAYSHVRVMFGVLNVAPERDDTEISTENESSTFHEDELMDDVLIPSWFFD